MGWFSQVSCNIPPFLKVSSLNDVIEYQVHIKKWWPPANIPPFLRYASLAQVDFLAAMFCHGVSSKRDDRTWNDCFQNF